MLFCPAPFQSQSSVGDLGGVTGVDGSGKLDKRGKSVHVNTCSIHFGTNSCVCACVCCSAHGSGCVVDGGSATVYYSVQHHDIVYNLLRSCLLSFLHHPYMPTL